IADGGARPTRDKPVALVPDALGFGEIASLAGLHRIAVGVRADHVLAQIDAGLWLVRVPSKAHGVPLVSPRFDSMYRGAYRRAMWQAELSRRPKPETRPPISLLGLGRTARAIQRAFTMRHRDRSWVPTYWRLGCGRSHS